jgi:hypothetical protein
MMKNRLKSIVLAIAIIAIVIVNNIGIGGFDSPVERLRQRVDAAPYIIDRIGVQEERAITPVGKNYSAGAKYIQEKDFSPAVRMIWDEGVKGLLEGNIGAMLTERPLNKDVRISVETIQIGNSGDFTGFSVNQNELELNTSTRGSIKFKTIDTFMKTESSFSVLFNLSTIVSSTLSIGQVTIKDVKMSFNPFTYNISNADEKVVELVINFFKKKGEFDLYMTGLPSKTNRKNTNSFKNNISSFIKSAIERYAPANILNKP